MLCQIFKSILWDANLIMCCCCQAFEINLIITDYCMPGMSGYDLLKKIKVWFYFLPQAKSFYFKLYNRLKSCVCVWPQESSVLKEIPVVIMSSENVPNRIRRLEFVGFGSHVMYIMIIIGSQAWLLCLISLFLLAVISDWPWSISSWLALISSASYDGIYALWFFDYAGA